MPTVLQLRFPARRYHATPWGTHVNEGVVEWPPSPWRLLRALLATGFTKCGWAPGAPPDDARALLETLAASPPTFALPPVSLAHSRHYVDAADKRPLILDAWARIEHDAEPIEVSWPCDLDAPQRELLQSLVARMGYLGRAESWVEARVAAEPRHRPNCTPSDGAAPGPGVEPVRVLCPQSAADYTAWRSAAAERLEASVPTAPGKKPSAKVLRDRERALAAYPRDLMDALSVDTGWLQDRGWSAAPGSREVVYWRRSDALEVGRPRAIQPRQAQCVPFALLAISTRTRNRSALPTRERVFPQGRLLHAALASRVRGEDQALWLLGRDRDRAGRTGHQHAHLLHLHLAGDGGERLDHALVWSPFGLDEDALAVLRSVRRTWMKGGAGELQVAVSAHGSADTLRELDAPFHGRLSRVLGPSGGATAWRSLTPFLAPRLTKRSGKDSVAGQVAAELTRRGLPVAEVEIAPGAPAFRHFVFHARGHQPPMPVSYDVQLRFARPVEGPICLGYGSHYGLGVFGAETDAG